MTKAETVQKLLQKLEDSGVKVTAPFRSNPSYWTKNPVGYVLDEVPDEYLVDCPTVESQLACFSKIALMRMLEFPIEQGVAFNDLWQSWGRNGLLTMPTTILNLDGHSYLQLRYNLFVVYYRCGFVTAKDVSGERCIYMPCDTMFKSLPYLALLSKKNITCLAIYWSYLVQAMAPYEEFHYLLRYNPELFGNFLIKLQKEHPEGFTRPVTGSIPPYALPQFVRCLMVNAQKLMHEVSLVESPEGEEFGRLQLGSDRVTLCVHQVDGEHVYSFDIPEWESERGDWNWDQFLWYWTGDRDLTRDEYNRFMWYRFSVLLLGLAGINYGLEQFYTKQSKRLRFVPVNDSVLVAPSIQDLEVLINEF